MFKPIDFHVRTSPPPFSLPCLDARSSSVNQGACGLRMTDLVIPGANVSRIDLSLVLYKSDYEIVTSIYIPSKNKISCNFVL